VLLLQDLELGGTQRHALQLLAGLDRHSFAPEAWVLRGGDGFTRAAQASGAPVVWLTRGRRVGPRAIVRLGARLLRRRPDVLVTLTVVPNVWGRLLGALARVPVIIGNYRSLQPRQLERWLWPLASLVICNADAVREEMMRVAGVPGDRIRVIPNGVALPALPDSARREDPPRLLFVGRLVAAKSPLALIEAMALVRRDVPDARLTMVGDGPERGAVESLRLARGLESAVELLPAHEGVETLYERSSVLVLPSASEASPNVVLEAMATALPVVCSRVGGIPELVEHSRTGWLVPPGDVKELAAACVLLLRDPQLRQRLGTCGREKAAQLSVERMVRATEQAILDAARVRSTELRRPPL
jgi:glycosyltransferase involved in cell wall biosynthesis